MSDDTIRQYLVDGRLRLAVAPHGHTDLRCRLIEAASVQHLLEGRTTTCTMAEAATAWGVTRPLFDTLVRAGLVHPVRGPTVDGRHVWRFSLEDLARARDALIGHLPLQQAALDDGEWALTFAQVLRICGQVVAGVRLPELVQAVRDRDLPAVRTGAGRSVGDVRFTRDDVRTWALRQRHEVPRLYSAHEVCQRLGRSMAILRRWDALGLLRPCEKRQSGSQMTWWYDPDDVAAFQERYVTAQEAAAFLGCAPRTVSRWTAHRQIPVVLGPHLDGSHIYRFDRAVLQQWKEERLAPNEAATLLGVSTPTLYKWIRQGKLYVIEGPGPVGHGFWYGRDDVLASRER